MISDAEIPPTDVIALDDSPNETADSTITRVGGSLLSRDFHAMPEAKNPSECRYCGKTFSRTFYRKEHERIHTGEKPYSCSFCARRFNNQGSCAKHERRHCFPVAKKLEIHECKVCKEIFNSVYSMKVHMRKHSETDTVTCNVCGKDFAIEAALRRHKLRFHSEDRPFKCMFCQKSYVTSYDMRVHIRSHTGERPYRCRCCRRGFITNRQKAIHETTHFKKNRSHCTICSAVFRTPVSLAAHMSKDHSGLPRDMQNYAQTITESSSPITLPHVTEMGQTDLNSSQITSHNSIYEHVQGIFPSINTMVKSATENLPAHLTGAFSIQDGHGSNISGISDGFRVQPQFEHPSALMRNADASKTAQPLYLTQNVGSIEGSPEVHIYVKKENETDDYETAQFRDPVKEIKDATTRVESGIPLNNYDEYYEQDEMDRSTGNDKETSVSSSSPQVSSTDVLGDFGVNPLDMTSSMNKKIVDQIEQKHDGNSSLDELLNMRRLHECKWCGIIFRDFSMFLIHKTLHGPGDPFECHVCGNKCSDRVDFTSHLVWHIKEDD